MTDVRERPPAATTSAAPRMAATRPGRVTDPGGIQGLAVR
jgi:hypothetical protein